MSRLADSVSKRIDFGTTRYGSSFESSRAWIRIDKQEILNISMVEYDYELCLRTGDGHRNHETVERELHDNSIFSTNDFWGSFSDYLNLSMNEILDSENPIIRAFGMLDSRVGKRRLKKINVSSEHDLVKRLFYLRCDAEGLIDSNVSLDLTSRITNPSSRKRHDPIEGARQKGIRKLAKSNRIRNFKSLLSRIHKNELLEDELETDISRAVYEGFKDSLNPDVLLRTLQFLESRTKLCDDVVYVNAFIAMTRDHDNWIRPLENWTPQTYNRKKQFASLARHLWAQYDVPLFMDNAWLRGNADHQQWYKDVGKGENIRQSANLPMPLTKKMAHFFLAVPDHYSIEGALRWGQVHALGGDRRLADALLETRLVEEFRDSDFWLSVIRFFVRNPMLDTVHIGPIIDYICNQRYEDRIIFVDRGVAEEVGPAQPNFSMRGRTVDALLRAVEAWHGRLSSKSKSAHLQWPRSGIGEFSFTEGNKDDKNMKIWRITELLNGQALLEEGRKMRHCVASYATSCHRGKCSIWSMRLETEAGNEKLLTIEVNNATRGIRQVRGQRNRLATDHEKAIIRRWAGREDLEYASYLS